MQPPTGDTPIDPEKMTFEAAIDELETLIARIEQGAIDLEASLEARRRGDALIRRCRAVLDTADQELRRIEAAERDEADRGQS